jgi:spore coat protein U-like protein
MSPRASQPGVESGGGVGLAPTRARVCALVAVAFSLLLWAPVASAQRCRTLRATPMVFTGYSPFGPGVSATSTLTYRCQPGTTQAWIGISQPRRMSAGGGNVLQFDVYTAADRATSWPDTPPWPVPVAPNGSVTVHGFLPPQDAAAGNYTGNLFVVLYSGPAMSPSGFAVLRASTSGFVPVCTIGAGTLAFGSYDPVGAHAVTPLDAQGTIQIACSRDAAWSVGLGLGSFAAGTTRQMASGPQRLRYELYQDAARTAVWSTTSTVGGVAPSWNPIVLNVHGRVFAGQAVPAGPYADTVQSTVNF